MKLNVLKLSILSIFAFLTINANAQVKVGNNPTTITPSAIFDVESTNKGVIFPRIALTSATDQTTIAAPVAGLLVYNTGTASLAYKGYVFWNGTEWLKLDGSKISNTSSSTIAEVIGNAFIGPLVAVAGGAEFVATTADGKFSVRFFASGSMDLQFTNIHIRSNDVSRTIQYNGHTSYAGGAFGFGDADRIVPTTFSTANTAANNWGDPYVFYAAVPENRKYIWTEVDNSIKRVYEADFFMSSVATAFANYPSSKCYIYIKEIIGQ